jgi:hypothetical protein
MEKPKPKKKQKKKNKDKREGKKKKKVKITVTAGRQTAAVKKNLHSSCKLLCVLLCTVKKYFYCHTASPLSSPFFFLTLGFWASV